MIPQSLTEQLEAVYRQQPSPELRADLVYDIVRELYDLAKEWYPSNERDSLAMVSDAALAHQDRMHGWT